jgi:TfoX/Sxy family transcriptional regulator of competence genes
MATQASTIDYILDQLVGAGELRTRKMFGEYALYCHEKVVGLVCDDQLFVKITDPGKTFVGARYAEGIPYPGARPYLAVDEYIDDHEWLTELVRITADALPIPKQKKRKEKIFP